VTGTPRGGATLPVRNIPAVAGWMSTLALDRADCHNRVERRTGTSGAAPDVAPWGGSAALHQSALVGAPEEDDLERPSGPLATTGVPARGSFRPVPPDGASRPAGRGAGALVAALPSAAAATRRTSLPPAGPAERNGTSAKRGSAARNVAPVPGTMASLEAGRPMAVGATA